VDAARQPNATGFRIAEDSLDEICLADANRKRAVGIRFYEDHRHGTAPTGSRRQCHWIPLSGRSRHYYVCRSYRKTESFSRRIMQPRESLERSTTKRHWRRLLMRRKAPNASKTSVNKDRLYLLLQRFRDIHQEATAIFPKRTDDVFTSGTHGTIGHKIIGSVRAALPHRAAFRLDGRAHGGLPPHWASGHKPSQYHTSCASRTNWVVRWSKGDGGVRDALRSRLPSCTGCYLPSLFQRRFTLRRHRNVANYTPSSGRRASGQKRTLRDHVVSHAVDVIP